MVGDAFENILGQPKVRDFLRTSVAQGRVSQAYLFCGPAGSNKTTAAYALAQALLCPKGAQGPRGGACGACDTCSRVARRSHPDVHFFAPEGAGGYLVDQIREIVADVSLAPIQADKKIYILDRVDLLGVQAANAFLKTLEEPPEDVVMILLARTSESVLPTIVSRCQVVPFRTIPASEAVGIVVQNSGATSDQARIALAACDGSLTRAVDFLRSNEQFELRKRVLEAMAGLRVADDWDVLCFASDLVVAAKAPLDQVRIQNERELEENADFLSKSAVREIEARNKRQLTAKSAESLRQVTAVARSWLRDVLSVCVEAPDLVVNADARAAIEEAASFTDEARVTAALEAPQRCDQALAGNVSPETCLDAMLLEVKYLLFGDGESARLGYVENNKRGTLWYG